jgi:UDP-glucuronate 4-epimerase
MASEQTTQNSKLKTQNSTLVTGGAGFIGSNLCDRLLARGERVVCVDNFNDYYDPALKRRNLAAALEHPNFRLYEADFRDRAKMAEIFSTERPSRIAHIGGMAGVRYSLDYPDLYIDVNVRGTLVLLELSRECGIANFVYASSSSVYGNAAVPFREDDPCNQPVSPYAASKKAAEVLGYTYHRAYGLNFTALRFFTVYGPRNRPDMAVGNFTRHIIAGTPLVLYGDGSMGRDYTYIDDHLNGVMAALDKPLGYEIINLGNSHPETTHRLIEIIEQAVGKRALIERRPPHPADAANTYADISKAQRLLGYQPSTRLEQGITHYVAWLRGASAEC